MKATELRIGNFVDLYSKTATVCRNDFSTGLAIKKGKPIRLTEEWLIDFGFNNTNTTEFPNYTKGMYQCRWRHGETNICNNHGFIKDLKYVHQLQNLYFALTGEELKINP